MRLEEGSELGVYRIVEQVGQGGMAVVYKAYQASLSRFVALKVLPAQLSADPDFQARFKEEATRVAGLRHPNILVVFDYGQVDQVTYIATEFVDGGTLDQQLGKPLPVEYVVEVLQPMASALDYAHARGVIHRDVKPSNILLARDGRPLLSDFGLARMMTPERDQTQAGMIMGTPQYMAPEQGDGKPGPESDIYSLGVVAYEMLTGRVPFTAPTPMAVILAHREDPLPMPRSVNPALSPEIEAALLKALARKPSDRYRSASALTRALAEADGAVSDRTRPIRAAEADTIPAQPPPPTRGPPPAAPPPPAPAPPAPAPSAAASGSNRRRLVAVAAAVLVVVAAGLVGALVLLNKPHPAPPPPAAIHPATWHVFRHDVGIVDLQPTSVEGEFLAQANGVLQLVAKSRPTSLYSRGSAGYSSSPGSEAYIAISPGLHVASANCDFPTDTLAALKLTAPIGVQLVDSHGQVSNLASITGVDTLNGITFDRGGRFLYRLLVTGSSHGHTVINAVSCDKKVTVLNANAAAMEGGLDIAPTGFGTFGGDLVAPDELSGNVLAVDPAGLTSVIVSSGLPTGQDIGVETAAFVPAGFMGAGGDVYMADRGTANNPHPGTDSILTLSAAELSAAGVADGDLLVATEGGGRTIAVRCRTTCTVRQVASGPSVAHVEGHLSFVYKHS